ncbi:MAG: hypothetical protein ABSG81_14525 [Acidimicrobiales bacterium]
MATHTPLAQRLPKLEARHATSRARLVRRAMAALAVVCAFLLLAAVLTVTFVGLSSSPHPTAGTPPRSTGAGGRTPGTATTPKVARSTASTGTASTGTASTPAAPTGASSTAPTVTSTLAPWQLPAPIEGEAVLPGAAGHLVVLGGSTSSGGLADGVFTLDTATGTLVQAGDLQSPVSASAAAVMGGQDVVFGGAMPAPLATVQGLALARTAPGAGVSTTAATVLGSLPAPRSGAAAVTVGAVTYVVGGSDGTTPEPAVLATTNGRVFTTVATLAQPVSFPGLAAVGGKLYVFGGKALTGSGTGHPVGAVQVVDPGAGTARLGGLLPEPVWGTSAVTIGGDVFLIGGATAAAPDGGAAPATDAVWWFDPATAAVRVVGHLGVAVTMAGVAVDGQTAWVVGGEAAGAPQPVVQSITVG